MIDPKLYCYADRNRIIKLMSFKNYGDYLKSPHYATIRKRVLKKNNGKCRCCCERKGKQVHHVEYTEDNLRGRSLDGMIPICDECHILIEFDDVGGKLSIGEAKAKLHRIQDERIPWRQKRDKPRRKKGKKQQKRAAAEQTPKKKVAKEYKLGDGFKEHLTDGEIKRLDWSAKVRLFRKRKHEAAPLGCLSSLVTKNPKKSRKRKRTAKEIVQSLPPRKYVSVPVVPYAKYIKRDEVIEQAKARAVEKSRGRMSEIVKLKSSRAATDSGEYAQTANRYQTQPTTRRRRKYK